MSYADWGSGEDLTVDDSHNEIVEVVEEKVGAVLDKHVKVLQVLQALISSLAGKDKTAKVLKYSLDVINVFVRKSRQNITRWDPHVLTYYKKVLRELSLWMVIRHPLTIIKVWIVAMSRSFEAKASYVSQQMSTYRYALRFGSSPFQVLEMWRKLVQTYNSGLTVSTIQKFWFNEGSLRDVINLWNTICDELVLLHKIKVWDHGPFYQFLERQEAITWEADILFSLKNKFLELEEVKKKQYELSIDLRARKQALNLSRSLHGSNGTLSPIQTQLLHDLRSDVQWNETELHIKRQLEDYRHETNQIHLDISRLMCDFIANTTDVFNMKVPTGTYAIFSLGSGLSGLIKLWKSTRRELQDKLD